jgi:hypothetical protein
VGCLAGRVAGQAGGEEGLEAAVAEAFERVGEGAERCEQCLGARVAEAKRGGGEAVVGRGGQDDALARGGVGCAGAGLQLGVERPLVDLVCDLGQRLPVAVGGQPADAEVAAVVDGRLGARARGPA